MRFQKNLNALARRYGRKKKRKYAMPPAVKRKAIRGKLGSSERSDAIVP